jgi:multiple sugar transport system substrate-binding protein
MTSIRGIRAALAAAVALMVAARAAAGALEIRFGWSTIAERDGFKALVDDFHAANPDVQVHLALDERTAVRRALPGLLAGDAPPDVINSAAGEPLRELARRAELDDVSDLWKANTWWTAYPTTAAIVTVDARQVGLPYDIAAWGLLVRPDALERAGLKQAPRDLSALLTACSKLRKAGFVPIALGGGDGWPAAAWFDYIDLRSNGIEFHQRIVAGKASYDEASGRRTFMLWKQLADAQCFAPDAATTTEAAAESQLVQGRAAMGLMPMSVLATLPPGARADVEYRRFPAIDVTQAAAEVAPVDVFAIAAHARNRADARRFLKFASSGSVNGRLATALGTLPANANAAVPGTLANLAASKAVQDAGGNRVQGFDRDTPAAMAQAGLAGFRQFLAQPAQMYAIIGRLDAAQGSSYASAAADASSAPEGAKKRKR